jgi:spore coat protein A, manganese oxidase
MVSTLNTNLTRLNAYSGMAGFYVIRDDFDTGKPDNPLTLPVYPFEAAIVVQDKMFKPNGELFYPAFPGDPAYADFITGEGAGEPPYPPIPSPSALAEFFGYVFV